MHTACAEKSVHPLRFTLLNIAYGMRVQNLQEVGYLPDLSAAVLATGIKANTPIFRVVKLMLLSKCVHTLLAPLKAASFYGAGAHTRTHTFLPAALRFRSASPMCYSNARPTHPTHPFRRCAAAGPVRQDAGRVPPTALVRSRPARAG
jgi:hypothetical protein